MRCGYGDGSHLCDLKKSVNSNTYHLLSIDYMSGIVQKSHLTLTPALQNGFQMKELRFRNGACFFHYHSDTSGRGLNQGLYGSEVHVSDHTLPHADSIH